MSAQLGFGCMRLPVIGEGENNEVDRAQFEQMVDSFLERGFTYFDTAWMYHNFRSELWLGDALVKRHPRDSFTIATKLPLMYLNEKSDQEETFNKQLEKLGVDYVDNYLLHNINSTNYNKVESFDSFGFGVRLREEGLIKRFGFSFHDSADLLDRVLTDHPEVDFVQIQLNYLDWEDQAIQSRRCYECACKHEKPVVVMEPIKGGLLAQLPESAVGLLTSMDPTVSQASWALRFAASLPGVETVLSGMSSLEQLEQNCKLMSSVEPLTDEEERQLRQIARLIHSQKAIDCTSCRYCVPGCPMRIPIPTYFALYNEKQRHPESNSPALYYRNISAEKPKASACIDCRKCVSACPQHIMVPEMLAETASIFEQ
ncbi:MAG: aldo/keto reductase [Atopobiaceae bacterium]|nr:aldo/keto reductase [Atopobiaceae bacterium]